MGARMVIAAVVVALASLGAFGQTEGQLRALERGNEAFVDGARLRNEGDTALGAARLREAVAIFTGLIEGDEETAGVRNARLYTNLGNAHMLLGETGRAVLAYRRALRLDPQDGAAQEGLAQARARVSQRVERSAQRQAAAALAFWRGLVSASARFEVALWAWAALWVALTLRAVGVARRGMAWGGAAALVVCAGAGATLAIDAWSERSAPDAVVVDGPVTGRKGPDERAYEASFTEPLRSGVEVVIAERRPGWARVRLADGRETWVPDSHAAPVNPALEH